MNTHEKFEKKKLNSNKKLQKMQKKRRNARRKKIAKKWKSASKRKASHHIHSKTLPISMHHKTLPTNQIRKIHHQTSKILSQKILKITKTTKNTSPRKNQNLPHKNPRNSDFFLIFGFFLYNSPIIFPYEFSIIT